MSERSRRQLSFATEKVDIQLCALCNQHYSHINKVATWQNTQAQEADAKYGIAEDDMVCRRCRDDLRKVASHGNR